MPFSKGRAINSQRPSGPLDSNVPQSLHDSSIADDEDFDEDTDMDHATIDDIQRQGIEYRVQTHLIAVYGDMLAIFSAAIRIFTRVDGSRLIVYQCRKVITNPILFPYSHKKSSYDYRVYGVEAI